MAAAGADIIVGGRGAAARLSGTTPAHTGQSRVLRVVFGGPLRTFAEASSIGRASTEVRRQLLLGDRPQLLPAVRARCGR